MNEQLTRMEKAHSRMMSAMTLFMFAAACLLVESRWVIQQEREKVKNLAREVSQLWDSPSKVNYLYEGFCGNADPMDLKPAKWERITVQQWERTLSEIEKLKAEAKDGAQAVNLGAKVALAAAEFDSNLNARVEILEKYFRKSDL